MTDASRPLPLAHYPRPRYPRDPEPEGRPLLLTLLAGGILGLGALACGHSQELAGRTQAPRPPDSGTRPPAANPSASQPLPPDQPGTQPTPKPGGTEPLVGAPQPPRPPKAAPPQPKDAPAPDRPKHLGGKIQPPRTIPPLETR